MPAESKKMSDSGLNKHAKFIVAGGAVIVLAGAVVASAALISRPSLKLNSSTSTEKVIKVKGVAEKKIVSDLGAFDIVIRCNSQDIPSGYQDLNKKNSLLLEKMRELGLKDEDIQNPAIEYSAVFREISAKDGNKVITRSVFSHYRFEKRCRVISKDVKAVELASVKLYDLVTKGVELNISKVEFFVSNLEQYKLELVDAATKSAFQRAQKVAATSGAELGELIIARQGVIQITRPASDDTSDYGVYDTRTINKVMRLVVTLEYSLK